MSESKCSQKDSQSEMKELIKAIRNQTEAIGSFAVAVMQLAEAMNAIVDGEVDEKVTPSYLNGERIG